MSNPSVTPLSTRFDALSLDSTATSPHSHVSEIPLTPPCSLEVLSQHLAFFDTHLDSRSADICAHELIDSVPSRCNRKISQEILTTCSHLHHHLDELPEILHSLERPLQQLQDPTSSPQRAIGRFQTALDALKTFHDGLHNILIPLSHFQHSPAIPRSAIDTFLAALDVHPIQQIRQYWTHSCSLAIRTLEERLDAQSPPPSTIAPTATPHPSQPASQNTHLDLSKVNINKFSGRTDEFRQFFGLLSNALDHNSHYAEVSRISFVISLLAGEPLRMIQAVPIQEGSLELILQSLQDRYGDKEDQSIRLLKELREKRLSRPRSHTELKDWFYRLKFIRRSLDLSESADHNLFIMHVFESLPNSVHRAISDHFIHSGTKPTIDEILARLDTTIRSQELFELSRDLDTPDRRTRYNQPTSSSCVFCTRNHPSKDCRTVPLIPQRQEIVRTKSLCLRCLSPDHTTPQCQSPGCASCQGNHHISVCFRSNPSSLPPATFVQQSSFPLSNQKPPTFSKLSTFPNNVHPASKPTERSANVPPPTIPPTTTPPLQMRAIGLNDQESTMSPQVRVANVPDPVRAFIDTGSNVTFVDLNLCVLGKFNLGPPSPRDILSVGGGQHVLTTQETSIELLNRARKPVSIRALAVRNLHTFFTGTEPTPDQIPIQIVLGQDSLAELDIQRTNYVTPDGHRVMDSRFGRFVVSHRVFDQSNPSPLTLRRTRLALLTHQDREIPLSEAEELERMYTAECFLGPREQITPTDREVMRQVASSVTFLDGRYWVKLPWLDSGKLPPSFGRARARLRSLVSRLSPTEFQRYKEGIQELIHLGFVERLLEWPPEHPRCYYLAHHAVFKTADSGDVKMRIVYDGSAHNLHEPSLNDLLSRGPVLLPSLQGVLVRFLFAFRAIIADLEKAFLQVGIQPEEQDSLRFLFGDTPQDILHNNLWLLRFRRLPFGLKCSPAILAIVIDEHFGRSSSPLATEIGKSLYVDNVLLDAATDTDVVQKATTAHELFAKAGMNLRDYASNSPAIQTLDPSWLNKATTVKVLGLFWTPETDDVSIKIPLWDGHPLSKRSFSSLIAKLFDPLDLLRPVSVRAHLSLQKYWPSSTTWDDSPLPNTEITLERFTRQFDGRSLPISRFGPLLHGRFRIHIFCDASFDAAGAIAYTQDCESLCSFALVSKAKLTPPPLRPHPSSSDCETSNLTVNTLEIFAVELGAKIADFLRTELPRPAEDYNIWTDSRCALSWISGHEPALRKKFVRHRVATIRAIPDLKFRHIPGSLNPADILSRGLDLDSLASSSLWWNGPPLLKNPDSWPTPLPPKPVEPIDVKICQVSTVPNCTLTEPERAEILKDSVSLMEAINRIRLSSDFSDDQAQDWLIWIDQEMFRPTAREIEQFSLVKEDDLWRVHGRLGKSDLPRPERYPIFLSKSSQLLRKLVSALHTRVHPNLSTTFSHLRRVLFVPGGQRTIKSVIIRMCEPCRRSFARPYPSPPFPELPASRVSRMRPFTHVGLDGCGPFSVLTHGRSEKVFLLVLTCFTTRYTHIEVLERGTTQAFVLGFRRFIALFGLPKQILSDNGRSFVLGSKVLKRFVSSVAKLGPVVWNFTTPHSPWQGGIYERIIRILKEALRKSLPRHPVAQDLFFTLVTEVGALLNHRPILSALSSNLNSHCLRPVDLVFPEKRDPFPVLYDLNRDEDPDYLPPTPHQTDSLVQNWNHSLRRLDKFWQAFHNCYLRHLQSIGRPRVGKYQIPKVGQVVLLLNPQEKNRNFWRTAVVTLVHISEDGFCRSVELNCNGRPLIRPLSLLAPLECPNQDTPIPDDGGKSSPDQSGRLRSRLRPRKPTRRHPRILQSSTPKNPTTSSRRTRRPISQLFHRRPTHRHQTVLQRPGLINTCPRTLSPHWTTQHIRIRRRQVNRRHPDDITEENSDPDDITEENSEKTRSPSKIYFISMDPSEPTHTSQPTPAANLTSDATNHKFTLGEPPKRGMLATTPINSQISPV